LKHAPLDEQKAAFCRLADSWLIEVNWCLIEIWV
jgi:hypothetical protein